MTLALPEIICTHYKPLQLEPCLFAITIHCLCYNWSTLWNCNEKNLFIAPLVSISIVENSTWTDVDSGPIRHFGRGFSPDHWWHRWRSAALQANSTVRSISQTQLNNRFQQSQLYNSLLLCISLTSQKHLNYTLSCGLQKKLFSDIADEWNVAKLVCNHSVVHKKILQDVGTLMLLKWQQHHHVSVTF